jgi:hypothetical protein
MSTGTYRLIVVGTIALAWVAFDSARGAAG